MNQALMGYAFTRPDLIGGGEYLSFQEAKTIDEELMVRLARGSTSGQALTGGAQLGLGSWAFMMAVFAAAFGLAYFVRRQWQ